MLSINWDLIPSYYHRYIQQVAQFNLEGALRFYGPHLAEFLEGIPENKWNFRYAPGKWSIKEMVQHIIDTERIFNYRALCMTRGEQQQLPGFDENVYAANSSADYRSKKSLLGEFDLVHRGTVALFDSFTQQQLDASGTANNKAMYVAGIGYIIAGHGLHHLNILKERYLSHEAASESPAAASI